MKVSLDWLRQYVEIDCTAEQLAERLTAIGLSCEGIAAAGDDRVLELEVPSNRPDCLGMIGVAREIAVALERPLQLPRPQLPKDGVSAAALVRVTVEDNELCPRYMARVINGVKIGPSPDWMQRRLTAVGLRPVNAVVDVTNYVLFETGQPLHAFDFDRVAGHEIVVRRARAGETMTLLDGSQVKFDGVEPIIADVSGPVAMAGVMGGARSEIVPGTVNVLLESAAFLPTAIRRAARRHAVSTDSSFRFERGVDWGGVEFASCRAAALIAELCGGEIAGGVVERAAATPVQRQVTLRYWRVDKLLGRRMEKHAIRRILLELGLESGYESGESITLLVPGFRPDLSREADLIEEVARHYGYDRIPAETGICVRLPRRSAADEAGRRLRTGLAAIGFSETVTVSILPRARVEAVRPWRSSNRLVITNPPRTGQDTLRESLLPSLLDVRRVNQAAGRGEVSLFDMGRAYLSGPDGAVTERRLLAALDDRPGDAGEAGCMRLRAVLDAACAVFQGGAAGLRLEGSQLPYMEPGESARAFLGGEFLGVLGRLHGALCDVFELRTRPWLLELDLDCLIARGLARGAARVLPRYPGVSRDVALVLEEGVPWSRVTAAMAEVACDLRESVEFLNVYRGRQLGDGRKSVAFSVIYRAPDRTLTDAEVNEAHARLVGHLTGSLGATLRS